jgi:hypothetical protein
MEKELIEIISRRGPLTGSELKETIDEDSLPLWQICTLSKELLLRKLGTRYLRFDNRVDGFARLTPSILREFLTYSVIGLAADPNAVAQRIRTIISHVEDVSKRKFELARHTVSQVRKGFGSEWVKEGQVCFIIAGDIVYNMAHNVPRTERSTGRLVNGSDIDLIVVLDDDVSEDFISKLDDAIYQEKYRILTNPAFKEEIDYVVKKVSRVREQLSFNTFKYMVACKILQEGMLLYGSEDLFQFIKSMLHEYGVIEKLNDLEQKAHTLRMNTEEYLANADLGKVQQEALSLFYPSEESEEFE